MTKPNYRDYTRPEKLEAYNRFFWTTFKATLVMNDENFLCFDWREESGSGNLATRYLLDKKKGNLIIAGDSGDCIASWYGEVTPKDMEAYVNDIGYFMEKMQCTSDKYTYHYSDVAKDWLELKNEFENELLPDYLEGMDANEAAEAEEEYRDKLDRLADLVDDLGITSDGPVYCDNAIDLIEDLYGNPWWETGFETLGKRVSKRVYLWSVGYQMGYAQLAAEGVI